MKIVKATDIGMPPITIRNLIDGYTYNKDTGEIRCYGGRLNPRPSYQREFVYEDKDQREVFKTLIRSFPLGTFYWCETSPGNYELIDGQQRTLSIVNICHGDVYLDRDDEKIYWDRLPESSRDAILDQELNVYICKGDPVEKMEWFKTINIVGKPLKTQEIRSAVFSGPFVSDARKWFVHDGKRVCQAIQNDFKAYVRGSVDRQEILEKALYWHANFEGFDGTKDEMITEYLRKHRGDADAKALWDYYDAVIRWADMLFNDHSHNYTNEQQKVEWGLLYNKYRNTSLTPKRAQELVNKLMENPEIEQKSGIYEFIFDGEPKHLSPRAFKDSDKRAKYEEQKHICAECGDIIPNIHSAQADHIIPWSKGGRTDISNLQILCVECNREKSDKELAQAKADFSAAE